MKDSQGWGIIPAKERSNAVALNEDNQTPCCIRSYSNGCLTLRDKRTFQKSVIINNKQEVTHWSPKSIEDLNEESLAQIIEQKPDIVLLGTGSRFALPCQQLLLPLHKLRIGVECMDTGAACRSYVALFAEDRNVLAALII